MPKAKKSSRSSFRPLRTAIDLLRAANGFGAHNVLERALCAGKLSIVGRRGNGLVLGRTRQITQFEAHDYSLTSTRTGDVVLTRNFTPLPVHHFPTDLSWRCKPPDRAYTDYWEELRYDPEQFQKWFDEMQERHASAAREEQRTAPRRGGRKAGSGSIDDEAQLDEMEGLIRSGKARSVNHAAKTVAANAQGASYDAIVDRLSRKFRQRD